MTAKQAESTRTLRQRAEGSLVSKAVADTKVSTLDEASRLLHELLVHQVELEMQNEELLKAQADLDLSRARYFDLYDTAPVGYCTVSEEGLIREANLMSATMLGAARNNLVSQPINLFICKDDLDIYNKNHKRIFETGEPQSYELRMAKKDGAQFWAHLAANIVHDADGSPECRIVMSDISDRKEAEEKTARLEAQLQQAQKMESVGRLAGGVAHDFNNMLGVIIGHADMAQETEGLPATLYEDLREIRKAADRSASLTRQLLAFARKQAAAPRVLNLNEAVGGTLRMLRRLIGEDILLSWNPGADLWPIKMDPSQLDQLLTNLCINSRDAIAGLGKVTIETGNVAFDADYCVGNEGFVPGEFVMLAVKDDGCGIDKETLAHIFEPFFTTKGVGEGTGLGLASVYGVVRQNGGFIHVWSEPGEGTTFRIYLPRHCDIAEQIQPECAAKPARRGHETILLVEDEPAILKITAKMLEKQGYTVLATSTPGEALNIAKGYTGEIDLLMTDVVMPEMNGRDIAKSLCSLFPCLKSLYMSGYTADIIAHRGVLDKGVSFIQKPFTRAELVDKVHAVLDG